MIHVGGHSVVLISFLRTPMHNCTPASLDTPEHGLGPSKMLHTEVFICLVRIHSCSTPACLVARVPSPYLTRIQQRHLVCCRCFLSHHAPSVTFSFDGGHQSVFFAIGMSAARSMQQGHWGKRKGPGTETAPQGYALKALLMKI